MSGGTLSSGRVSAEVSCLMICYCKKYITDILTHFWSIRHTDALLPLFDVVCVVCSFPMLSFTAGFDLSCCLCGCLEVSPSFSLPLESWYFFLSCALLFFCRLLEYDISASSCKPHPSQREGCGLRLCFCSIPRRNGIGTQKCKILTQRGLSCLKS